MSGWSTCASRLDCVLLCLVGLFGELVRSQFVRLAVFKAYLDGFVRGLILGLALVRLVCNTQTSLPVK